MNIPNRGGRPRKVAIDLNPDSLTSMMQNIWNEAEEMKTKAITQYNKQIKETDEKADVALIGKINADFLKIANDCIEKKISVTRIMKDYIQKDTKDDGVNGSVNNPIVTDDAKERIQQMLSNMHNPQPEEYIPKSVEELNVREQVSLNEVLNSNIDDITDAGF